MRSAFKFLGGIVGHSQAMVAMRFTAFLILLLMR
jgi:divalent metal cation (Fe/Co/Zn/Cd) transporter